MFNNIKITSHGNDISSINIIGGGAGNVQPSHADCLLTGEWVHVWKKPNALNDSVDTKGYLQANSTSTRKEGTHSHTHSIYIYINIIRCTLLHIKGNSVLLLIMQVPKNYSCTYTGAGFKLGNGPSLKLKWGIHNSWCASLCKWTLNQTTKSPPEPQTPRNVERGEMTVRKRA